MPLVKVEMIKGRSPEYKKAIFDGIHSALVETFKIPDYDRMQRIYELDKENFEIASNKTEQYILIEIIAYKGRSLEAKKLLYSTIVKNLENNPGINGKDITIVIHEPPLDNWGIWGGKAASEVDLGFKLDV